jgi:E1A/CREB-binding protein
MRALRCRENLLLQISNAKRSLASRRSSSSCHNPQCGSTSCWKVGALFQHAVQCTQKVTGGCHLCKKMWCLLNLHAKSCTTSDCPLPRCRWGWLFESTITV